MNSNEQRNRMKKATNRDVARLAGVSVATVSYVINGRKDQHITEATKKKVYQAMNFLNYSPNPYAVGLNTHQPQTIVIRSSMNASPLTEAEILHFMHAFHPLCEEKNMQLSYSLDKRAAKIAATACVCFDLSNEEFRRFADENFIPVIAMDSFVNDPIFYQITTDFEKVNALAESRFGKDFTFVHIEPTNKELKEKICSAFSRVRFVSSPREIREWIDRAEERNVVLVQPSLFSYFEGLDAFRVFAYDPDSSLRPRAVMDSILKALERLSVPDEEHFIRL